MVRCDASEATGLGHAARAFALAEALSERLDAIPTFLSRRHPLLERFLAGRGVELRPLGEHGYAIDRVLELVDAGSVLVSDTYELDEAALRSVAESGARHVVVDDFGALNRWPCHVVVNPNVGASHEPYRGAGRVLVGARYALVRREIRQQADGRAHRSEDEGTRLLVCLGGGEWPTAALGLLEGLGELAEEGVEIRATVTGDVPDGIEPVATSTLPAQLAWADAAVLSAGVVKYEAAACGLPALLVAAVPHQEEVGRRFAELGIARYLGPLDRLSARAVAQDARALLADAVSRQALGAAARAIVDGLGANRVADAVLGDVCLDIPR